jgi:O-antigen/teichoic acid export membrane protein
VLFFLPESARVAVKFRWSHEYEWRCVDPIMERSSHHIIRKFTYLISAHWVREALQSIFLIYLARKSSTTYGEFMLALSIGQILLFVAEFGINQHLVTLLARKEDDPGDVLAQASVLKTGLLVCGGLGVWTFVVWQGYPPTLKQLVSVIALGLGLEALASSFFVLCQVRGRQDAESRVKTLAASLGFGYGLTSLYCGAAPILVAFYKLIETLVNLGGAMLATLKEARSRLRLPTFARVLAIGSGSLVFTLMAMTTIIYNKANIFFLQKYAGADGVAQYSVTWQIVDGISCLASNLLLKNVLFPLFVKLGASDRDELSRVARNTARWLMVAALPTMFILFIESDRLITLVYGPVYSHAIWMQKVLVVTVAFAFLHNLAAYLMVAVKKERLLLAFYIGGLAINLLSCSLLIPWSPLLGTVLSIVLTKGSVALLTVTYCQVKLALISGRSLVNLTVASLLGFFLYFLGFRYLGREVAEISALIPVAAVAWRWWAEARGET